MDPDFHRGGSKLFRSLSRHQTQSNLKNLAKNLGSRSIGNCKLHIEDNCKFAECEWLRGGGTLGTPAQSTLSSVTNSDSDLDRD